MKALVLGNRGFIGKKIYKHLTALGVHCVGLDFPDIDFTHRNKIDLGIFHKLGLVDDDVIINCTGINGAQASFDNLSTYYNLNGFSAIAIEEVLEKFKCRAFVHISSETVLGEGMDLTEESAFLPKHPYAFSKAVFESYMLSSEIYKKITSTIIRLPIVIGNPPSIPSAYDYIKKDILENNNVILFGDGEHKRKFLNVDDIGSIVQIILKRTSRKVEILHAPGKVLSMKAIYDLLSSRFKQKPPIIFKPPKNHSQVATLYSRTSEVFSDFSVSALDQND